MATFGLRYFAQLRSKYKGVFWRVEIAERDYSGPSEEMEFAGGSPLSITWENRGDEFYVPVKASEATINVMCHDNFHFIGLFTSDPRKWRVSIYRNTVLYWRGFVVADLYSESFTAPPYEVSIKAVDGFNLLSNVSLLDSDFTQLSGRLSLWDLLTRCFSLLELDLSISDWMDLYAEGMSESLSPLRQVYVDMARLYYVYEEPTYRDALELCLRPFAGQIFQSGGSLHIRRAVSLYNDSRPLSFYEVGADFPQGWLVTADGKDILTAEGDPIITTMSRDRIDSMWESEINVLGESTLEIVPAIRKVSVQVKNKMMANLVDQMSIYDLSLWDDPSNLLSLVTPTAIYLKGNKSHLDEVLYGPTYYVDQSAYTMIFQMHISTGFHYHSVTAISSTNPISREHNIPVKYGFRLVAEDAVYYIDEDGSWKLSDELFTIEEVVKTSEGSDRKIEMEGFPASGLLQFFIVENLSSHSDTRTSYYSSATFSNLSLTLDTSDDYDNELSYALAVNAANNTDMEISLPISDIPKIPNDRLIYSLYFVDGSGEPTRMWHTKGLQDYNSLVGHLMACALRYKQLPAKRISGEMFTGRHIDMNTVVQDDRYLSAGFFINSIELDACEDSYDSELVEMPRLLRSETPPEGDDCICVQRLPFTVLRSIGCVNQIALLSTSGDLYVYDTITGHLTRCGQFSTESQLYPADDSFVISDETGINVIDYRGSIIKHIDRDYLTPATFMGSSVYGINRYNIGRNGAVVWSYFLGKIAPSGGQTTYVRTSGKTVEHTSFGTSPSFLSLVKSYASIVVNEAKGAYLYDRRSHPGTTSTFFEGVQIVSLSDYFMCQVKNAQLLIYRRDSITEQTLVKTIAINPLHCAHTLSEVAYAGSNHAVRLWDYRTNTLSSVINGEAAGAPLRGLYYINGSLFIVRQGAIYKHIPNTK